MFDKNEFKQQFRQFVETHTHASEKDAQDFCYSLIPAEAIVKNQWLIEQSIQWFRWIKNQRKVKNSRELCVPENH